MKSEFEASEGYFVAHYLILNCLNHMFCLYLHEVIIAVTCLMPGNHCSKRSYTKILLGVVYFDSFIDKAEGKDHGDDLFWVQKVVQISA